MNNHWQFWLDVGGTFTDCLALSPDQTSHHCKVLSSGLIQGQFETRIDRSHCLTFNSNSRKNFWVGGTMRLIRPTGEIYHEAIVSSYDSGSDAIGLADWPGDGSWSQVVSGINAAQVSRFELDHLIPAPVLAMRKILNLPSSQPMPDCSVYLGTTRGTNALLTRTGASTAFVTTSGFRDLLLIGDQSRPDLFDLTIRKLAPLFTASLEIEERILADGTVEMEPVASEVRRQLSELKSTGIESVAICLMHGFRYPQHEQIVGKIARELGFKDVRISSDVAPLIKILARAETTVLDAYLNPVLENYLDQIQYHLSSASRLQLMTSAGGLVNRELFSGKDSVLSGPAGGIVGAARVAEQAGFKKVLSFDMGGTSTDVGRVDKKIDLEFETCKSGVRILMPMVAIETVAAGGGSICRFDGTKLVVGPESATSEPGPACYGRGGPLAVTDVNLFLGRLVKRHFPFPLDESAVHTRLQEICDEMGRVGFKMTPHELAIGFLEIANQNMAAAIRSVSVARGYDPAEHLLVAFGGAGPQHCCAVAESIGIDTILDPLHGSILSAVGIQLADQTFSVAKSILRTFDPSAMEQVTQDWQAMEGEVRQRLGDQQVEMSRSLDLRYQGTEASQTIAQTERGFEAEFASVHQTLFGFTSDRPLEIVASRVEGRRRGRRLDSTPPLARTAIRTSKINQPMWLTRQGKSVSASIPIFDRNDLVPGDRVIGPAIIAGELSTTIVDPSWTAMVLGDRQLLLQREDREEECKKQAIGAQRGQSTVKAQAVESPDGRPDPVRLEIFNNYFSTIARQMGISLQMTSMSVNVKERLDFSCAIFTRGGDLVVNAPHIPVHLGAMSETVRGIIRMNKDVHPGDVFVTNDPFAGGSHLPDITVVSPVFDATNETLIFWVASRSHHAEIGGCSPGSMPPNATCLSEEGVLIRNFKLVDGMQKTERFDELELILTAPPYPSRMPRENLADIRAQTAANRSGQRDLLALVDQYSIEVVHSYMGHIQSAAEQKVRTAISKMEDGRFEFHDALDNGATIRVCIDKSGDQLTIDFTGTDPVLEGNQNANPAIVASAVIYVMRCLIEDDIPLNEGVIKPVSIVLPECFLNPASFDDPDRCPAVVGGNVETSQRIVDVLLGALQQSQAFKGIAAASQGTMNNWLMGDPSFGYYETLGGGAGATADADGADAVHTHMTNTRLTDPEILEDRYPVILREFSIRPDSGGQGRRRGGNGMVREIEFMKSLTVSLLTNRRTTQPYGIQGGAAGQSGRNELIHEDQRVQLPSQCEIEVQPGDRLRIETPGGGGMGST